MSTCQEKSGENNHHSALKRFFLHESVTFRHPNHPVPTNLDATQPTPRQVKQGLEL
jgi:hypothetical protein